MGFPEAARAAPAMIAGGDPCKSVEAGRLNVPDNKDTTAEKQAKKPLIDRHGHRHSEAVLHNWSPAILKAMGVRRIKPDEPEGGVV